MHNSPSYIHSALEDAWNTYKNHFIVATANSILFLLSVPLLAITIIGLFFIPGVYVGYLKSMIDLARDREVQIGGFFKVGFQKLPSSLGLAFIKSILLCIAYLFFIIPGIYLNIAWIFAFIIFADTNRGVMDSLSYSRYLVSGRWWDVFFLYFILSFLSLLMFAPLNFFVLAYMTFTYIHYYVRVSIEKEPMRELIHDQVV